MILKDLDLMRPSNVTGDFWVAETDSRIVGVSALEDKGDHCYLSSVGVIPDHRKKGIASRLIHEILKSAKKDVYLHTIIPDFFKKFGFDVVTPSQSVPIPGDFDCTGCQPNKCVCMLRRSNPNEI
jgi:N-acetylglutamate synthase-like GNAT family acetyltransferase